MPPPPPPPLSRPAHPSPRATTRPVSVGDWILYKNLLIPKKSLLLSHFQKLSTVPAEDPLLTFTFPNTPKTIEIHKSRLSLTRGPLSTLPSPPFKESTTATIHLPEDNPHTFAAIRALLYLHPLDLSPHLAHPRLPLAAHRWHLPDLFRAWFAANRAPHTHLLHTLFHCWPVWALLPLPHWFRPTLAWRFACVFPTLMKSLGIVPDLSVHTHADGQDPEQLLRVALEQRIVEFASSSAFLLFAELARDAAARTPSDASSTPPHAQPDPHHHNPPHPPIPAHSNPTPPDPRPEHMWRQFAHAMANAASRPQVLDIAHRAAEYAHRTSVSSTVARLIDKQGVRQMIPARIRTEKIWALSYQVVDILRADHPSTTHPRRHTPAPVTTSPSPSAVSSPRHCTCEEARRVVVKRPRSTASLCDHRHNGGDESAVQLQRTPHRSHRSRCPTATVASCSAGCAAAVHPSAKRARTAARLHHASSHSACATPVASASHTAESACGAGECGACCGAIAECRVPIAAVEELWRMFHERGLLRYVVYYVSRFCEQDFTSVLLRGILQTLESNLTDRDAIALLKLLDWEKPDMAVTLSKVSEMFSRHALRLMSVAQAEVLARGDSELRFSFTLKHLVRNIKHERQPYDFWSPEHRHRDHRFVAHAYCEDVSRGYVGPLMVAVWLKREGTPLPHDVVVHARVRAISNGCGCVSDSKKLRNCSFGVEGIPVDYGSSRTGVNLMIFERPGGERYRLYSSAEFREWMDLHKDTCSLKVYVDLRFGSVDAKDSARRDDIPMRHHYRGSRVDQCHCATRCPTVLDHVDEDDESDGAGVSECGLDDAYNSDLENDLDELSNEDIW